MHKIQIYHCSIVFALSSIGFGCKENTEYAPKNEGKYCGIPSADSECPEEECCSILSNFDFYSYYSLGKSPGICENYGATGLFYSPSFCCCNYGAILDVSGLYFENCHYGASIGGGIRVTNPDYCTFGGAAVFYDFRKGKVDCYHQIGLSLELIGQYLEFRANAYIPLNNKTNAGSITFFEYDNTDVSTPYVASVFTTEFSLTGADAEIGIRNCWNESFAAYVGVGPYYFNHKCDLDFWGVQGHIRLEYGRFVSIDGQATWDDAYRLKGRVQLEINIPFSAFCNIYEFICCPSNYQRRVFRDSTVHLQRCCNYTTNF